MSWFPVPFPPRISFGIECDPEWGATVVTTAAGWESRDLNWSDAKHSYDASLAIRTATDHKEVRAHFHMARGRFHSWPLLDPLDHEATITEGVVVATPDADVFQMQKLYGDAGPPFTYRRKITRPNVVAVRLGGVLKTEGVDFTLDHDTGLLTYTGASAGDLTWAGEFYVPCRYDTNKLPVRIETRKSGSEFLVASDGIPIVEVRE